MGRASDVSGSAAESATDTVREIPHQVRSRTAGNPLAAGVIALGIGWLIGSLLPASQPEQQMSQKVKEAVTPQLRDSASEMAENLREPVQQALQETENAGTCSSRT